MGLDDTAECHYENENPDKDDEWSEINNDEVVSGMCDTMLSAQGFLEPDEREYVYTFAPGE